MFSFLVLMLVCLDQIAANEVLEQRIRDRITARPFDPVGYRLLGRVLQKRGDIRGAENAFLKSLQLDNTNPATHSDLGSLFLDLHQPERAIHHLKSVVELAPGSEHAADAQRKLQSLRDDARYTQLVSSQVPWMNAPRPEDYPLEETTTIEPSLKFKWEIETGLLFNSNVELAPISRQLEASELGGFQGYVAPNLEYRFLRDSDWQIASLFDSYFNLNEGNLQAFNLQHFKPGMYIDHSSLWGSAEVIKRVQYDYSIDLFDGQTFGNRHSLTTSFTVFHESPITSIVYWTIDYTDFQDDGTDPTIDSVDGMTNTVGFGRSWKTEFPVRKRFDVGADFQWADLKGRDQAYRGVFVYVGAQIPLVFGIELLPTAGWGYRDFPDFTGTPSRNENLIVAGIQLEKTLSQSCRLTTFFNFEDFDTATDTYNASRYTTGMFVTFGR